MTTTHRMLAAIALVTIASPAVAQTPAGQPARPTASVNQQPRVDVLNMPRPIDMHDSVWIEDLTMMEVRDRAQPGQRARGADRNARAWQPGARAHARHGVALTGDYISSIIMVHDTDGVRMPERVKAGKFVINGVSLAPAEKTIENGKKIVAFRTEKTVAAIKKAMETAKGTAQ